MYIQTYIHQRLPAHAVTVTQKKVTSDYHLPDQEEDEDGESLELDCNYQTEAGCRSTESSIELQK